MPAPLTLTSAGTRLVQASRDHRADRLREMLADWPDGDIAPDSGAQIGCCEV